MVERDEAFEEVWVWRKSISWGNQRSFYFMIWSAGESICRYVFLTLAVTDSVVKLREEFNGTSLSRGEISLSGNMGKGLMVGDDFKFLT